MIALCLDDDVIFQGSPVIALGVQDDTCWYVDAMGQQVGLTEHPAHRVLLMFAGDLDRLAKAFPVYTWGVERSRNAFDHARLVAAMMRACAARGVLERVNGELRHR